MIDVFMSVDTGAKKINVLFGERSANLNSATIFNIKLPADSCYDGYIDHSKIFSNAFNELLFVNKIYEANIYLCLPSTDLSFDFFSVPESVPGAKKDAFSKQEIDKLLGEQAKNPSITIKQIISNKDKPLYMYSLMGQKIIDDVQAYTTNTNHTLTGITVNSLAIADLVLKSTPSLFKEATYFLDIGENKSEIMLLYNGDLIASTNICMGTNLLKSYISSSSALNKSEIQHALRPLQVSICAFIEATDSLTPKAPLKCWVNQADSQYNMSVLFNSNSTVMYEKYPLPKQYKLFPNNIELISAYLGLVKKEHNFLTILGSNQG